MNRSRFERIAHLTREIARLVAELQRELGDQREAEDLVPKRRRPVTEVDRQRARAALARRGLRV